jgi:hypothetical protein
MSRLTIECRTINAGPASGKAGRRQIRFHFTDNGERDDPKRGKKEPPFPAAQVKNREASNKWIDKPLIVQKMDTGWRLTGKV